MEVSRETPDVTTQPRCYDLTNTLVQTATKRAAGSGRAGRRSAINISTCLYLINPSYNHQL